MKVYLSGYPGSKHILPASSFLIEKYLNKNFEVNFLNFGDYDTSKLFIGNYVKLDEQQIGGASAWAKYLREYFKNIDDEYIVFGLDDFFLCKEIDMKTYEILLKKIQNDPNIVCARLAISSNYKPHEYDIVENKNGIEVFCLKQNALYSASTQYGIWRTKFLIDVLEHSTDAWHFELDGSLALNKMNKKIIASTTTCLPYCESSSLTKRHPNKVSVLGIELDVVEDMIINGLLDEDTLILGQPIGKVSSYSQYKHDFESGVDTIDNEEYRNYCKIVLDKVKK